MFHLWNLLVTGGLMLNKKVFVYTCMALALASFSQLVVQAADGGSAKKSSGHSRHSSHRNKYAYLVPPPPPTPVSPSVLAAYGRYFRGGGISQHFMPSKPRTTVEDMKLTAVMDDVAFFKVHSSEESIHLRKGGTYQSVTVAQVNPAEVVLEEKGKQFVKHLQ